MAKVNINLNVFLTEFGLSEREISLYLTLLKTGPNTIMNLARETGIKRSTTHNNVEELIKKGLISQTNYGERRMVVAEAPEKLKFLIEQKKWSIKKMEEGLGDVVEKINKLVPENKERNDVEVKYYTGVSGFKDATQRSVSEAQGEILQISNMTEWRKIFTYEYAKEYYIPARLKKKIYAKTLAIKDDTAIATREEDKGLNREMKFLPEGYDFKTTMMIYGKEVSIMTSSEPYTAIVITNEDIADALRSMFNMLWNISA